jgi:hypothetical protein
MQLGERHYLAFASQTVETSLTLYPHRLFFGLARS